MCRACGPNHRRCPSSAGPLRSARDRANYAAQKAAGLLPRRTPSIAPTATLEAAPVPSPEELLALSDDLQSIYAATDTDETYTTRQALLAKHGSAEAAVRHFGQQVALRAEMHAGVTADDIARVQDEQIAEYTDGMAALNERTGVRTKSAALEATAAEFSGMNSSDPRWEEVRDRYRTIAREYNTLTQDPEFQRLRALHEELQSATAGKTGEMLAQLRDGYSTALAEVRPMGGTMQWESKTAKAARTAGDIAAQVYPSDWIDRSNDLNPLRARISKRRAHYVNGEHKMIRRKVVGKLFHQSRGEDMTVHNGLYEKWERVEEEDNYGDHAWRRTQYTLAPYDYSTGRRSEPKNKTGWEEYTDAHGEVTWRKPQSRMEVVASERVAELTMNATGSGIDENTYKRVTIHELGHRMQTAVPGIAKVENAFIQRRTTLTDGTREEQVNVSNGAKGELGWADSFAAAYMGREYRNSYHTEIISTGSEALFSGSYGGLVGAGGYRRDDEMRNLILGLYGSAGRRN